MRAAEKRHVDVREWAFDTVDRAALPELEEVG
jgi:hypothetical protein